MKSYEENQSSVPVISVDNIVAFPDTEILINVSDKQTVDLVLKSIKNNKPLAICSREAFFDYTKEPMGCLAYASLDGTGPNGTYYILLNIGPRVYLRHLVQEIPYPLYTYELVPELPGNEQQTYDGHVLRNIKDMLFKWADHNIPDSIERSYFTSKLTSLKKITNFGCMYLLESQELKQSLLENGSLFNRTYILNLLLKDASVDHLNNQVVQALLDYNTIEQTSLFAH